MIIFNRLPYLDDYTPDKKFHRVLFKPGFAVQARELTQLQTALQEQIKRFGDNIFKQGSVITGCAESHNFNVPFVKIKDVAESVILTDYIGQIIHNDVGVKAVIKYAVSGSESEAPNLNTLYLQYTSNDTTTGLISTFVEGDALSIDDSPTFEVAASDATGEGSLFALSDGIVYANGNFIIHSAQTIVVDRYDTSPTKNVGFVVNEEIVTSEDDATLLDPARGSFNFSAPGADRYKISTILTAYSSTESKPQGFFLLFEVEDGVIKRRFDKTQYADLGVEMAQRTYDESGNYTIQAFPIFVSEHLRTDTNHGQFLPENGGDPSKLVVGVEPGRAYVRGFEQEIFSTERLVIDKAINTKLVQNEYTSTKFGTYFLVNNVSGPWSINTNLTARIYNVEHNSISGGDFSNTAESGTGQIGTAKVRAVYLHSSLYTPGNVNGSAVYRLHLYDIVLTSGAIANVRSIVFTNADGVKSFADVVDGEYALQNTKSQSLLFPLPRTNTKTVEDVSYVENRQFSNVPVVGGNFTIALTGTDTWAFTTVDKDSCRNNIMVVHENDTTIGVVLHKKGRFEDFYEGNIRNVTMNSNQSLSFAFGEGMSGSPTVTVIVKVRSLAIRNTKTLLADRYIRINTNVNGGTPVTEGGNDFYIYSLGVHDLVSLDKAWISVGTYAAFGLATEALMDASTDWTDITDQITLVDGTTDNVYGIAQIKVTKAFHDANTEKGIIVKFSFFSHGTIGGYYTIDSYPLPEENVTPDSSQIAWENIPKYTTSANVTYNLRDTLDFRPSVALGVENGAPSGNVAGSATTPQLATANPSKASGSIGSLPDTFVSGVVVPDTTSTFIADIEYHLPRIDRIVLDGDGIFQAVAGVSTDTPVAPREPDNSMTLGFVNIPAYPSLSPFYARLINRPEYSTSVATVDNRRFTMKNIGQIQERLEKLEFNASLSSLEQGAENLPILNSTGESRYKCGILVDPFLGHNVGNVFDSNYACSIADGILRPQVRVDNIDFTHVPLESVNIVKTANDAIIVVRQLLAAAEYQIGSTVTGSGVGSGTLVHNVLVAENTTYRWVRLYLEQVSGSFGEGNTINSSTGVITYSGIDDTTLVSSLRPDLVATPLGGIDFDGFPYTLPDRSLATLPYVHVVYSENPYASQTRECSSPILFTYDGTVELTPNGDSWVDSNTNVEVQLNQNNLFDNWKYLRSAWGTHWKSWDAIWHSISSIIKTEGENVQTTTTPTTGQRQSTDGISFTSPRDLRSNILPFIRSNVITFRGSRLKANTKINAFFDGIDVGEYCKLSESTSYGGSLITDESGNIEGQFRIPEETFISGSKLFVLTDHPTDPQSENRTISASATYVADGLSSYDRRSILSTQIPAVTFERQLQTQNSSVARQVSTGTVVDTSDPLAQTFFVSNSENGVLATKVDVYFSQKSNINSITLQLREVVNGYPSDTILPYSSVTLDSKNVNISTDGSSVTEFKFPSPVYLKNNTEYCFVLIPTGNSEEYVVWESEVGKKVFGSSTIIDKQPNAGTLFAVGNNRMWTEFINEDLKFTVYTAEFIPGVVGTIVLTNTERDYLTLTTNVTQRVGDQIRAYLDNTITTLVGTGIIMHYDSFTKEAEVRVDSGQFFADTPTPTSQWSYGDINSVNGTYIRTNKLINAISPTLAHLSFNNAQIVWSYKVYGSDGSAYGSYSPLAISGTTELASEKKVYSRTEHQSSFKIQGIFTTSTKSLSPIIDLNKQACVILANEITTSTDTGYISRTVVLDDGQDAEDLRVYLSAVVPSASRIKVFSKILHASDPTQFEDRPWAEMHINKITTSPQFNEYFFTHSLGATTLAQYLNANGTIYRGFRTFAIKVVMTGDQTTQVPLIRDLRAIALLA